MTPSVYEPNYEFIRRSLSKTGIEWKKCLPRPPIINLKKEKDLNSSSIDYSKAMEATFKLSKRSI